MSSITVAALLHDRDDRFDSAGYLLRLMIDVWRGRGTAVEILRGAGTFVPADVVIPHLDLTITPPDYQRFLARYPRAVNARLVDISKSAISGNLVSRGDAYAGPVIVKTNCNFGGVPESRLKPRPPRRSLSQRIVGRVRSMLRSRRAADDLAWRTMDSMKSGTYPIFPALADVPAGVFANPNLIVEKFLPEVDKATGEHVLRYCYFFGERQCNFLLRSKDRVVKGANATRCDEVDAPQELDDIRHQLSIDYGKLDYVIREGRVVLFDVNRTPAATTLLRYGVADRVALHLADGLTGMLDRAPVAAGS